MKKSLVVVAVACAVVGFFALGLDQLLTLDNLKARQAEFQEWRDRAPVTVSLLFFCLYVAVITLSLPGGAILSLAAGGLFGLVHGFVLVSLAATIGATLAFLVARYLLRDWVQRRFGDRLTAINRGMAAEGAWYLFTLRLVPIFPFFLVNILMALTPVRTSTYAWVSLVGMLPGTLVFVNAGTQLARIDSLSGVLSPGLLLSFALLGLFPLLARRISAGLKTRRVYARYRRPKRYDRNLIVIGGGAAGLVSAYIAAAVRARVTLVEAHKMGGDCLNTGCVPSKTLIRSAELAHRMKNASRFGLADTPPRFSFRELMQRVHRTIEAVAPHDSVARYTGLGVEVLQGHARIVDPWTVEITMNAGGEPRRLTSRAIVIAAGAEPVVPDLPGMAESGYLTSETMWEALREYDEVPARLVILGGGPIGCELAQSFARLGSRVILVQRAERLLVREDPEVSAMARSALEQDGVTVLTGHVAVRCERETGGRILVVEHRGMARRLAYDVLICAVGRRARLSGYGLAELGIAAEKTVAVGRYLETLYPNIYAAGDVAGPYQFTHTAGHQAWYAAVNGLFGEWKRFAADYSVIPWTTFIDPEVARVGLNEQEAAEKGIPCEVTRFDLAELDRAITDGATRGMVKVLTVPGRDRILGVTIVGRHGGDLLAEFVLAMKYRLGLNKILGTIHTYPTLAEANRYVAGEWKKAHAPARVLALLERYHAWKRG